MAIVFYWRKINKNNGKKHSNIINSNMKKIEHIGIAVKDFSKANGLSYHLLGAEP